MPGFRTLGWHGGGRPNADGEDFVDGLITGAVRGGQAEVDSRGDIWREPPIDDGSGTVDRASILPARVGVGAVEEACAGIAEVLVDE